MRTEILPDFWVWLLRGINGRPGYRQFNWKWTLAHVSLGILLSYLVKLEIHEASKTILLPLSGIFVGLSFAWAGNAHSLLQDRRISELGGYVDDGIVSYLFTFQLAVLVILLTLALWGLAGLGVFDSLLRDFSVGLFLVESVLYFFACLSIRECWHVVVGSNLLLISKEKILKASRE